MFEVYIIYFVNLYLFAANDNITPTSETPSPDKVQEEKHTEL